jgi:hypothetical protein
MKGIVYIGLLLCALLILVSTVSAHLDAGQDVVVNGYLIDFGYDPASPIIDGRTVMLFNLLNASTNESIYPDHVWVRISKGDNIMFSGQFRPAVGSTTFTYTFSEPGKYDIDATFYGNETVLVQKTLNIDIRGTSAIRGTYAFAYYGIIILLLIIIIILFLKRRKRR